MNNRFLDTKGRIHWLEVTHDRASIRHVPTSIHLHSSDSGKIRYRRCRGCGCSLKEFREQGFLGCSRCYTFFWWFLQPCLRMMHAKIRYAGKYPVSKDSYSCLERIEPVKDLSNIGPKK